MVDAIKDPTRQEKFGPLTMSQDYQILMISMLQRVALWRLEKKEEIELFYEKLDEEMKEGFEQAMNYLGTHEIAVFMNTKRLTRLSSEIIPGLQY